MEFKGRIYKVLDEQSGTNREGNPWRRLEFIFEYFENENDRYSDKVVLSIMNDRIEQYKPQENDNVPIGFSPNVREYQGWWYNELRVYKYEHLVGDPRQAKEAEAEQQNIPDFMQ